MYIHLFIERKRKREEGRDEGRKEGKENGRDGKVVVGGGGERERVGEEMTEIISS